MGKQHLSRDDRIFMRGKLQGTRENMDMVAMVLMDKCGWHVFKDAIARRDKQIEDLNKGMAQLAKAVAVKEENDGTTDEEN